MKDENETQDATEKKEGFGSKLKKKFAGMQDKWDLGKTFDDQAEELLDLSDGSTVSAQPHDGCFLFKKNTTIEYDHLYYLQGKVHRLSNSREETEVPYSSDGHTETISCFETPYEVIVDPVGDLETALDILKHLLDGSKPGLLGGGKTEREQALKDFGAFAATVRSAKPDPIVADAFIKNTAAFLPCAAALSARLLG